MTTELRITSIRSLYTLALAEGEGAGTAYEYYAKGLVLRPWLRFLRRPRRILIAGLPQRYGLSLDFVALASDLAAELTIVDERPERLASLERALNALQTDGWMLRLQPALITTSSLADIPPAAAPYDLVLSSEVLQRLPVDVRREYVSRLLDRARAVALFAPNGGNQAHTTHSGLAGLTRAEMNQLLGALPYSLAAPAPRTGFVDMPPFPPGITRSGEQREQAARGRREAAAMSVLELYARFETLVPYPVQQRQAHIVYGLAIRPPQTG
jgi:hypothetical protein